MRIRSIKPEFWRSDDGVFVVDPFDRKSWKRLGEAQPAHELVYRLYGDDMRLLYVGITWHPFARWTAHASHKPWWHQVAYASLSEFPDDRAARDAETVAIHEERPLYNIHQARRQDAETQVPRPLHATGS